ncbi:hypothetical protein DBP18_21070 [Streptomyces sp. CS081A]|nr:hypothetical protein DBP18_21070 [Streptomyces sp. CS081A]
MTAQVQEVSLQGDIGLEEFTHPVDEQFLHFSQALGGGWKRALPPCPLVGSPVNLTGTSP